MEKPVTPKRIIRKRRHPRQNDGDIRYLHASLLDLQPARPTPDLILHRRGHPHRAAVTRSPQSSSPR
ncbi:MAG: hypothetical protein MZV64_60040 [Ignavibacteriales bacterium]|nr:hypothetical protein [Ignavibacteriales bacterium]